MINRRTPVLVGCVALGSLAFGLGMTGCGGGEEQAVAPPPPPVNTTPPPPPPPRVKTVEQLMADLGIDSRIVMAEEDAPETTEERVAVLEFFDAFVRGDDQSLGSMLSMIDRVELEKIADTDMWKTAIADIGMVTITAGKSPFNDLCALALFEVGTDFQPQLWYYQDTGEGYEFDAVAAPPDIMERLYGDDWIARWHKILDEDMELASQEDDDERLAVVDLDDREEDSGGSATSGSPGRPTAPRGPGRRPANPSGPRRPPGSR